MATTTPGRYHLGFVLTVTGQVFHQVTPEKDLASFSNLPATEYVVLVTAHGYEQARKSVDTHAATTQKLIVQLLPLTAEDAALQARLSALSPKSQQQLGKAMDALRVGDPAKARHPLDALQRQAPDNPEVNYLLGVYASKTHDADHARSYWTRTLELDPKHLDTLFSLSDIYLHEKKFDAALSLALRAVAADPSSWRAHAVLASAYSQENNYPEALLQAQRAIELGHAQAAVVEPLVADLLGLTGNQTRAIAVLQSYLSDHPTDDAAKAQLARFERGQAAPEGASAQVSTIAEAASDLVPITNWLPPDVDEKMPSVESSAACNLTGILQQTGARIQELVANVDRYTATETVFHESITKWGTPASNDSRKFDYLASISELRPGIFNVEEYRNVGGAPGQFPEGVDTLGLPSMALLFHPHNQESFDIVCEGLTHWDGLPVWQLHFRQRPDKPNTMRSYTTGSTGVTHAAAMKGRAWIAADSYQIVRLETELVAVMPEIRLFADHSIIEYGPVQFRDSKTEMWLPTSAEIFFYWKTHRMHRRHTFSDFLLFSVDNTQKISGPKNNVDAEPGEPAPPTRPQ
jgi:tetratricopeptide (TPR) repeat protein